jgi:hypothetical protein
MKFPMDWRSGKNPSPDFGRRRFALAATASALAGPLAFARSPVASTGALRDSAILSMRRSDLDPAWFNSSNWGNRAYDPWTDYLTGRISDEKFAEVCARPSDYCLRDVWNLRREALPRAIQRTADPDFNWNGIHALALRYFRTGEPVYARKWVAVVRHYAEWSAEEAAKADSGVAKGVPAALLNWAFAWGGIFTAMAVIAKSMQNEAGQRATGVQSPFQSISSSARQSAEPLPAEDLAFIAQSFARGAGPELLRNYSLAKYVPNQRMFGLEAVAYFGAFFPSVAGSAELIQPLEAALKDVLVRYRHKDGGQLEPSFNYAQDLANAADRLAGLYLPVEPAWRKEALATSIGWYRMAAAVAVPGGTLPQLGNAAWGRTGRDVPEQRFSATSFAFPYSGCYVMRSDWTPQAGYLFFYVRRAARGHGMAGSNSIQLAAYGRQLVTAGGSASYKAKAGDPVAAYLSEESTFKTSTVVVDGRSQRGGTTYGLATDPQGKPDITIAAERPLPGRWHTSTNFDYVEGQYTEGYERSVEGIPGSPVTDVTHWRQVVFIRSLMMWAIVDVMRTAEAHRYTQVWKFSAPKNGLKTSGFNKEKVQASADLRVIRTIDDAADAVNVALYQFCGQALEYRTYFGEGPYGYFNLGPLTDPAPAVDVHASWNGRGPQVVVTLISAYRGTPPDVQTASDLSGAGVAGCRMELSNGTRVHVMAAATPRPLTAAGIQEREGDLIVVLEQPGKRKGALFITGASAREISGDKTLPITAPTEFRWTSDASGILRPVYSA